MKAACKLAAISPVMNKVMIGFLAVFVCGGSSSEMTPEGESVRDHINLATEALCATGVEQVTLYAAQSVRGAGVKDWSLSVECEKHGLTASRTD